MPAPSRPRTAYLVNLYPKVSHAFIRREILALESLGVTVSRFAVRRSGETLVDEEDRAEADRTRVILDAGMFGLLWATIRIGITRPMRFLRGLRLAMSIGLGSDRGLLRNLVYLCEACVLEAWLKRDRIGHLHAHFGTNSTAVAMLCQAIGGPGYSFTAHGSAEFDRLDQIGITAKIDRARFVIAVSKFGRSQLMRKCSSADWPKIHVVHCGVDAGLLTPDPTPVPDVKRLICVGRLCEQKGQVLLVEAVRQLKDEGTEVEIVLVGDGEMRRDVERAIEKADLGDAFTLTGWASGEEVRTRLEQARALVLPSFVEGLPVVIMEAFAMGRPVLSTFVGGIPELVKPGENGWLMYPGDVDSLKAALMDVLATPVSQLSDMGQAGCRIVREEHNSRTEAGRLSALLDRYARDGGR